MLLKKDKKFKKVGNELVFTRQGLREKIVFGIVFVLFTIYALSLLIPLLWLFINSFQDFVVFQQNSYTGNAFALPKKPVFENYVVAFTGMQYGETYFIGMVWNSIWQIGISIICGIFLSACTGYIMAKYNFKLRSIIYGAVIFSIVLPIGGSSGARFKFFTDLGVYDTPLYTLICAVGGFGTPFLMINGFFKSVSWEYAEAAFIDGASDATVFFRVMLPQAVPIMCVLGLMSAMGQWNDYMSPLLYMPSYPTVASGLYGISLTLTRTGNTPAYFAGLVISMVPILVLFACFSNVILQNYTLGGLKG